VCTNGSQSDSLVPTMRLRLAATAALVLCAAAACGGSTRLPPAGLTAYGQVVWNLDALLHDTFGGRQVWEDYGRTNLPDYSTEFLDLARSVPYAYTFSAAHHSAYRAVRTAHPPTVADFVTGGDSPIRVSGAYVSCGHGLWLYEHSGQALPGGELFCAKSHH